MGNESGDATIREPGQQPHGHVRHLGELGRRVMAQQQRGLDHQLILRSDKGQVSPSRRQLPAQEAHLRSRE
jgi:hypothetical protein